MTSPHPRRLLGRALSLCLSAATVSALCFAVPAGAQTIDNPDCVPVDGVLREDSESSAVDLAAACGVEVLIESSQDYTKRSFAQPEGTIASEFSMLPQWVPDETGVWVDADPTIEPALDGTLGTVATTMDMEFGSAGQSVIVTATTTDAESVSLSWSEPLPQPEVEGATVRYPEVMPGVDLEVYAEVASFSYALVVKTAEAAANEDLERIELGLDTVGLEVDTDDSAETALLTDAEGEVAISVSEPWMWDSSAVDAGAPELSAPMELEIDADSVAVIPDQSVLTDPEAEYPVYIDPEFEDNGASFENVYSQKTGITCGSGSEMCTGKQTWEYDGAYGYWRTAMKFSGLAAVSGRDIQQASVWITQTHTGGANAAQTVRLYAMDWWDFSASTSWNTYNNQLVSLVATDSVPTSNTGAGESNQTIAWADSRTATRIQAIADSGSNTAVFGVVSGSGQSQEDNMNYWRKLDPSTAKLKVWHAPLKPKNLYTIDGSALTDDACSTSAPGPTINTLTPSLKATAPADLETTNTLKFYVYNRNGVPDDHLRKIEVPGVAANQAVTVTVPSGVLERGKTYRWNSRIEDSDGDSTRTSDFTGYCYFTVNSLPSTPIGLSTDGLGCGTQTAPTVFTSLSPKLAATPSDPDGGYVTARFQVYSEATAWLKDWEFSSQSGVIASTVVTAPAEGLYKWRAATEDAFATSAWSGYCWVRIDTTAPEPPDVVQVTANPLPGQSAEFEFIGGTDVRSFSYSFDSGTVKTVSAMTGRAGVSISIPSTGSINHTLRVWAWDVPVGSSGNDSSPTTYKFIAIATPPAEALGTWRFDGDLLDDAGTGDLAAVSTATYGADQEGRSESAAVFDGTDASCVRSGGPVVNTLESTTFAAWVRVDAAAAAGHTLMNVTGSIRSNLKLSATADGRWVFSTASADAVEHVWTKSQTATGAVQYGAWTHVAGVYDAPSEHLRLYVNGDLSASARITNEPWAAGGVFSVGCGAMQDGSSFGWSTGSIDEAAVFQQALTGEQIQNLMTGEGLAPGLQAWYPLRGDGLDESGRGGDLAAMPVTPDWTVDQHGRPDSALEFDGSVCPTSNTVPVRTDSAFSVSAWVRLDDDHANLHPRIFSFNGTSAFSVMTKYNSTSQKWNVSVTNQDVDSPTWGTGAVSDDIVPENIWTHIAVAIDPDNNLIELFVNGEPAGSGTIATAWAPWRASEFVIGCDGRTDGTRMNQWDGAISDVRVWRGVLDANEIGADSTEQVAAWSLDDTVGGADEWATSTSSNALAFAAGNPVWHANRYNRCGKAYGIDLPIEQHAFTDDAVLRTDESFTVSAWAKIDDQDGNHVVVSQATDQKSSFYLAYLADSDTWQFALKGYNGTNAKWSLVNSLETPVTGRWYHLAGVYDLGENKIRLYVDGVLQGEVDAPANPWHGDGPLLIGANGSTDGTRWAYMNGSIDQVQAWSGALDPLEIAATSADRPQVELSPIDCSVEDGGDDDIED